VIYLFLINLLLYIETWVRSIRESHRRKKNTIKIVLVVRWNNPKSSIKGYPLQIFSSYGWWCYVQVSIIFLTSIKIDFSNSILWDFWVLLVQSLLMLPLYMSLINTNMIYLVFSGECSEPNPISEVRVLSLRCDWTSNIVVDTENWSWYLTLKQKTII
jgi:hypothetical protein